MLWFFWRSLMLVLCYQVMNSYADFQILENATLFEGDIMLTAEQENYLKEKSCIPENVWPKYSNGFAYIPYAIHPKMPGGILDNLYDAISQYREQTCIWFYPVDITDSRYKVIIYPGGGCYTQVGYMKDPLTLNQYISLDRGCESLSTIVHELGHAVGMFHEQSRPDRDEYLIIREENIRENMLNNFYVASCDTKNVLYDYSSVMHYGFQHFTKTGAEVIITKAVDHQYLIGRNTDGLTHRDALLINRKYGCIDSWLQKCHLSNATCLNDGFVGPKCKCVCPRGTAGKFCQNKTGSYYPENPLKCGGNVTKQGKIETPRKHGKGECTWLIVTDKNKKVVLTVVEASFYRHPTCRHESVTIRYQDIYLGETYCNRDDLPRGTTFMSSGNKMVVHWSSNGVNALTRFRAVISFQ